MEEKKDIFEYLKKREIESPSKDFFDNLADKVIEESSNAAPVVPIFRKVFYWTAAAAAVIVVVLLLVPKNNPLETDVLAELAEIPKDELLAYVDENIDEFETDLIVDAMSEEELSEISFAIENGEVSQEVQSESTIIEFNDIERDDILKYFESEGIELDDIEDSFI